MRFLKNLFVASSPLFCSYKNTHNSNLREQPTYCECRQVCDPDGMLSTSDKMFILEAIGSLETKKVRCEEETISLRMRVFVESEIPNNNDDSQNATVLRRADSIRMALGEPYQKSTSCGDTTVLLYVNGNDANMLISKGPAVEQVELSLPALEDTEYYLQHGFYAEAVQSAILEFDRSLDIVQLQNVSLDPNQNISTVANPIDSYRLSDSQIVDGHHDSEDDSPPMDKETDPSSLTNFAPIICFVLFAMFLCCAYASGGIEFERALKEIDQGDMDMLRFKSTKPVSCPRCLNKFNFSEGVISLDCCHTFCVECSEALSRCPICHARSKLLGKAPVYHETRCIVCLEDYRTSESSALTDNRKKLGSDGKRLKILPCGHTMDQTCFDLYGEQLPSCPYCSGPISIRQFESKKQKKSAYQPERIYRIRRLATKYPNFCTKEREKKWLKSNMHGRLFLDYFSQR